MWNAEWRDFKVDIESRFAAFKVDLMSGVDKHHAENRTRLQAIDTQSVANGVKLDTLFGSYGQPGVVDRLSDKVDGLGNKIMYGCGIVAATVVLVGWYLSLHGGN